MGRTLANTWISECVVATFTCYLDHNSWLVLMYLPLPHRVINSQCLRLIYIILPDWSSTSQPMNAFVSLTHRRSLLSKFCLANLPILRRRCRLRLLIVQAYLIAKRPWARNKESTMATYNRATELGAALRVKPGPLEVDELLILLHPLRILHGASPLPPILTTDSTAFSLRKWKTSLC